MMKELISRQEIATPAFIDLAKSNVKQVITWIKEHSNTLVLKPKKQAGSRGIGIFKNTIELIIRLTTLAIEKRNNYLIQEYLYWSIIHIDGLVRKGELQFVVGAYYLDTCLEWLTEKKAMGSVLIAEPDRVNIITQFSFEVVKALKLENFTLLTKCP